MGITNSQCGKHKQLSKNREMYEEMYDHCFEKKEINLVLIICTRLFSEAQLAFSFLFC